MSMKNKEARKKRKYSTLGCFAWAMKKLWRLDRRFVFFMFAGIPVAVVTPLVSSYFSKYLIDSIGSGAPFSTLAVIVGVFIAAQFLLRVLDGFIDNQKMSRRYYPTLVFQTDLAEYRFFGADYENTEKQDFQQIQGYVWGDAGGGGCSLEFFWEDISKTLIHISGIVTYISLLAFLKPVVFAVVLGVSVLSYFTTRWQPVWREKNKHRWEKEIRKKNYVSGLSEDFSAAKDIRLYGLEGWIERMMRDYQHFVLTWEKRGSLRGLWASVLAGLLSLVQNGVAYVVLIGLLFEGELTAGDFVFYFGIVGQVAGFMQSLVGDLAAFSTRAEKIAYYRELYDYPNVFNHGEGCALPAAAPEICLRDVWYKYDGAEEYTLKGIDLTLRAGESLALVGMNGAGKTTLVKLICGFYRPTKGEILVDGRKIDEYNIEKYYSMISAVFQKIVPVALTMFEFVASFDLSRPDARADAEAAMRAAGIWEKIAGLENGMDTHLMKGIYDDGVDLSGGEMQKLVLARAIYKNGHILVLDEPTAALDPIAEDKLYQQYRELTKGKTSVYISHRFASTRFCDRILLLEDGVICESGTHAELMKRQGKYAHMFGVQAKYYQEGEKNA